MAKKTHKQLMGGRGQAADADPERLGWWKEARFGMFIHWGLYAIPAGTWKGESVSGIGEWIMYNARIPVTEYEKLAGDFNPVGFNAREWVAAAKAAGMRYLVITAKHHDGFALFHSPSNPYNIVDATPFGRDPMAELAAECKKEGIALGFYYSQDQDWHDPDGAWNDWDFAEEKKNFDAYFRRKVVPQITELLTQYGPIGLIWFDTPYTMGIDHSLELRELVHRLQPDCLVSGRVGNDQGDYGSLGDNQIPVGKVTGDYETPATMNDTWGFRRDDENWKSPRTLLFLLIDLASKGINYLLNVGPTETGLIPKPSLERLSTIGRWTSVNGEAIHGTTGSPFPYELPWGRMTSKGNNLYLIFFDWPADGLRLFGLRNEVISAYPLADRDRKIDAKTDTAEIRLSGFGKPPVDPGTSAGLYPVVVLELDGQPLVDAAPIQQQDGSITLPAFMATLHQSGKNGEEFEVGRTGFTDEWRSTDSSIKWQWKLRTPGKYEVRVISAAPRKAETRNEVDAPAAEDPHRVSVGLSATDGDLASLDGALRPDIPIDSPRAQYYPEVATILGSFQIDSAGIYEITLQASYIDPSSGTGLAVSGVELIPVE